MLFLFYFFNFSLSFFFFQAEDGIRDYKVTGVQTCALPIFSCARNTDPSSARTKTNESHLLNVFPITARTSMVASRIGQDRRYLNAGRIAGDPFAGDEISAGASND